MNDSGPVMDAIDSTGRNILPGPKLSPEPTRCEFKILSATPSFLYPSNLSLLLPNRAKHDEDVKHALRRIKDVKQHVYRRHGLSGWPPDTNRQPLDAYQTSQRRFLPLVINGLVSHALPDTGVRGNAMTEDFALSIGAIIEQLPHQHEFTNAKNRKFGAVGTTQLVVAIPDSDSQESAERKWACSFAVVKQLAAPLVLGSKFLRMTETLTSFAHLLVKKTMSVFHDRVNGFKKVWRFMHMDLPTQELACVLDGEIVFASLDSGSDIDVVSLDYANSRGWKIMTLPDDEGYVLLANNELVKLTGYVETSFMISEESSAPRRFYVLDGLMCDAVLGDSTIEALDIFDRFRSSIIDLDTVENMDCFHMIQWVEVIDKIGQEVEQILSGSSDPPPARSSRKTGWKSFLSIKSAEKYGSVNNKAFIDRLRHMREEVEVCSANWRRSGEAELLTLAGDEYTRRKQEFDRRKEQNDQVRDNILSHIVKLQTSTTGSGHPPALTPTYLGQVPLQSQG